ncbi:thioredoxin-like protein [Lineolata rhizophorae]|uniref:Thioredoxin-like protein n=1 Tax=Lineolata rhizophorae TaxID=578093 RepID=A0A6A6P4P1_9PEZI|nr:thioredoxin-like protein [Lineolata rhizophorae]
MASQHKITHYTDPDCPWCHRVDVALKVLGVPHEKVTVDLDKPREPWYYEINPKGTVPSLKYSNDSTVSEPQIIPDSGAITQFLADLFPPRLLPPSDESPSAALVRARMTLLLDAWSKVPSKFFAILLAPTPAEQDEHVKDLIAMLEKDIEPMLGGMAPFFGGSKELTYVEVMCASILARMIFYAEDGTCVPSTLKSGLDSLPKFSKWATAVATDEIVASFFNAGRYKTRMAAFRENLLAKGKP